MKKNKMTFLVENKILPTLYIHMVFVESISPVLFTCQDDDANIYICSCHCQNAEKCEWIIAPTTYRNVIDLLTDRLSIRGIFLKDNAELFVATMRSKTEAIDVVVRKPIELDSILPKDNYYMEAESGEFENELEELRIEALKSEEFSRFTRVNNFKTIEKIFMAPVSIPPLVSSFQWESCFEYQQPLQKFAISAVC